MHTIEKEYPYENDHRTVELTIESEHILLDKFYDELQELVKKHCEISKSVSWVYENKNQGDLSMMLQNGDITVFDYQNIIKNG